MPAFVPVALTIAVSLYDFHFRRVPNWVTLPLLLAGIICHFPGTVETCLACVLLFMAWHAGWMGGGDAKLWMALLWLAPSGAEQAAFVAMAVTLVATGLLQLVWRKFRKRPATGIRSPSAWRTIPYAVWLFTALLCS
jgi:Flp pilus assembly protein protease CpaA